MPKKVKPNSEQKNGQEGAQKTVQKPAQKHSMASLSPQQAARLRMPARSSRVLLYAVALGFFLLLIWACFATLDTFAQGTGQVVPSQRVQLIQNLEGGILGEISVTEGQLVEKDDILVRIDNEAADSQYRDARYRALDIQASLARLRAENLPENAPAFIPPESGLKPVPPQNIPSGIPAVFPVFPPQIQAEAPELITLHTDLFLTRQAQRCAEYRVMLTQRETRLLEAAELETKKKNLEDSLVLAQKQVDLARPLVNSRAYSTLDFLSLEQKVQSIKGELAVLEQNIPRTRLAAQEMDDRLAMRETEWRTQNQNEILRLEAELRSLEQLLSAGADRVRRTEVRSPVRGIVQSIHISTIGGVIKPGENILSIIPVDDQLIIEAKISPSDIAFIYPSQQATVRISAYDYSVYGSLDATVTDISADTMEGKQGEVYYRVKLKTTQPSLSLDGKEYPILPGMMAQVDIHIGQKTVLEYLLKPLTRIQQKALRER